MKCVKSKGEGLTPRSRVPGQHIRTDRTYKRHFIAGLSSATLKTPLPARRADGSPSTRRLPAKAAHSKAWRG
jgi:hypothetical protein